jgi:hypothetical protein
MPGQTALFNRANNPCAKIHRIRLCHPYWPPSSSQQVESDSSQNRNPKSTQPKTIPL